MSTHNSWKKYVDTPSFLELGLQSDRRKIDDFFFIFPEIRLWQFMQIVKVLTFHANCHQEKIYVKCKNQFFFFFQNVRFVFQTVVC